MQSPSVARRRRRGQVALDRARVLDDGLADGGRDGKREHPHVVRRKVARRHARRAVRRAVAMALDLGARAKEPEQRSHGGVERAGHLRDQHPHLAALGERVGVLPLVRRDVALARRVVEGAVRLRTRSSCVNTPRCPDPPIVSPGPT